MDALGRWRRRAAHVIVVTLASATAVCAQTSVAAPLFRIFFTDGTSIVSFGEFARVGDRVVFSLPLGEVAGTAALHLSSVPADRVDWLATEQYREAARGAYYAASRGEEDFAAMSGEVARLLNDVVLTEQVDAKLALAERARRRLSEWPGEHFGYKQEEVRQILGLVDEVVSELRAARGERSFDFNLVAQVAARPAMTLLPPPTLQESIQQALAVAPLAASAADRVSLLQAVAALIDRHQPSLPEAWLTARRSEVARVLAAEQRLDRAYADLRAGALRAARRSAGRADVRGVQRVIRTVQARDRKLGSERGNVVTALLRSLQDELDAARRLRLARDQWALVSSSLRAWSRKVTGALDDLGRARATLDDIRALAGPGDERLQSLESRFDRSTSELLVVAAPDRAQAAHAVLLSAFQLARNAVRLRRVAARSGDLKVAWDASAAASGAMLLYERARDEVARAVQPPALQ